MSVCKRNGTKVILPRSGSDLFWSLIEKNFAQDNELHWKYLAMLALRTNAGWNLETIGKVFGHPKGHVTRCLERIKNHIRERFEMEPEFTTDEEGFESIDVRESPTHFGDAIQQSDPEFRSEHEPAIATSEWVNHYDQLRRLARR